MPAYVSEEGVAAIPEVAVRAERLLLMVGRAEAEWSIVLCDDAFIQPLNLTWRGKDVATDVLSFPQEAVGPVDVLGDVVISLTTAARQAAEQGHGLLEEVTILLVHGLCHLLGHDHHDAAETATMRAAEQRFLAELGVQVGLVARARQG